MLGIHAFNFSSVLLVVVVTVLLSVKIPFPGISDHLIKYLQSKSHWTKVLEHGLVCQALKQSLVISDHLISPANFKQGSYNVLKVWKMLHFNSCFQG